MRKLLFLGLLAAGACAHSASAAIVTLTMTGAYDGVIGPAGAFGTPLQASENYGAILIHDGAFDELFYGSIGGFGWSTNLTFDTSKGVLTDQTATGHSIEELTWNSSMGTSSPLISGTYKGLDGTLDLSAATSFTVDMVNYQPIVPDHSGPAYSLSGAGWSLADAWRGAGEIGTPTLSDPYSQANNGDVLNLSPGFSEGPYAGSGGYLFSATLTLSSDIRI